MKVLLDHLIVNKITPFKILLSFTYVQYSILLYSRVYSNKTPHIYHLKCNKEQGKVDLVAVVSLGLVSTGVIKDYITPPPFPPNLPPINLVFFYQLNLAFLSTVQEKKTYDGKICNG